MKKLFTNGRINWLTVMLIVGGISTWTIGILLPPTNRLSPAFEHLGLGIVVTILVATAINSSFESAIRHAFSIVKGAEGASTRGIYEDRNEDALRRMFDVSGDVGRKIDLLCVAGTSFLHTESKFLGMLDHRRQLNSNIEVRVLLLDPRSRYAILRCLREESIAPGNISSQFHYASRKLCSDILTSVRTVEAIQEHVKATKNSECPHFNLKVRLYDAPPKMLYFHVDDQSFVEQYHDGIPKSQIMSALTKCLGKAVPVMEVTSDSKQGRAYQSHFQHLWDASSTREIHPGAYDKLNASIACRDWVEYHLTRICDEESLMQIIENEGFSEISVNNRIKTVSN